MRFRNEAAFTDAVVDLARLNGWLVHHDRGEMRRHIQGTVGFPDLLCARPATYRRRSAAELRIFAAELKMPKGKPTAPQQLWLESLSAAMLSMEGWMIKSFLWYPSDWDSIVQVLGAP